MFLNPDMPCANTNGYGGERLLYVDPAANNLEYTAATLYFTAGPNGEQDGLLGMIKPQAPLYPPAH